MKVKPGKRDVMMSDEVRESETAKPLTVMKK